MKVPIEQIVEHFGKRPGVDLTSLEAGTLLVVETENTTYNIEILENKRFKVEGGEFFPRPLETYVMGCTFGGSTVKTRWIGVDAFVEMGNPLQAGIVTTTIVKSITIKDPNKKWEYTLNAESSNQTSE